MDRHLPQALRVFGYLLIISMIIQLINYVLIFGYTPMLNQTGSFISQILSIFGAIATAALHGAVGLLCFAAASLLLQGKKER